MRKGVIEDCFVRITPFQKGKSVLVKGKKLVFVLEEAAVSINKKPVCSRFICDFLDQDKDLQVDLNNEGVEYSNTLFLELPRGVGANYPKCVIDVHRLSQVVTEMFEIAFSVTNMNKFGFGKDSCMVLTQEKEGWSVSVLPSKGSLPQAIGVVDGSDPVCFIEYVKLLNYLQEQKDANIKRVFMWVKPEEDNYFNIVFV